MKAIETIVELPLDSIEANRSWNVRKYLGDDSDGSLDEHSFTDLVDSIRKNGQDIPIIIRPAGKMTGSDDHYLLTAGFRRYAAFKRIYEGGETVPGIEAAHIEAVIRPMSEIEARALNGRENIGRKNLNMADTAYLVNELSRTGMSNGEVAYEIALSPGYVSQLRTVYNNMSELRYQYKDGRETTVFEHWREAPGRVPYEKILELSKIKVDPKLKELKYIELLNHTESGLTNPIATTKRGGGHTELSIAEGFGAMVGRLEAYGLISLNVPDGMTKADQWHRMLALAHKIKYSPESSPEYLERILHAVTNGYLRGLG